MTQITVDEDLDETMAHLLDILLKNSNWDLGTLGNVRIIKIKLLKVLSYEKQCSSTIETIRINSLVGKFSFPFLNRQNHGRSRKLFQHYKNHSFLK